MHRTSPPRPGRARRGLAVALAGAVGLLGAAALTACGGDPGNRSVRSDRSDGTDRRADADPATRDYVGLTRAAAIAEAEAAGVPWRITRVDDERFSVTQDFVATRVNFEIDDGVVTRATFG
jgi:hypothetical protein